MTDRIGDFQEDMELVFQTKMLDLNTIREINKRVEQLSLDYDIPYVLFREPAEWQRVSQ